MKMKQVSPRWTEDLEFMFLKAHGRAVQKEPKLTKETFFDRIVRKGLKAEEEK
jgi:hypothetical protein